IFSFLAVCPGLYFRNHYYILILPAIALLIGSAAEGLGGLLARWGRPALQQLVPVLLVMAAIGYGFYRERICFFMLSPLEMSYATYGASPFPAALQVGDYLRNHTTDKDSIAVLGSEPEIYFYAGRRSATAHIYMYGLMEDQPFAEQMQQEMIRQIEQSRPKYCVLVNMQFSWLVGPNSRRTVLDWMDSYLKENYLQAGVTEVYDNASNSLW